MSIRKRRFLRIKTGKIIFEITPSDLLAASVIIALILNFYLLLTGDYEASDKFLMFFGGYGVGALIQQILTSLYHEKRGRKYENRRQRSKKPRKAG